MEIQVAMLSYDGCFLNGGTPRHKQCDKREMEPSCALLECKQLVRVTQYLFTTQKAQN